MYNDYTREEIPTKVTDRSFPSFAHRAYLQAQALATGSRSVDKGGLLSMSQVLGAYVIESRTEFLPRTSAHDILAEAFWFDPAAQRTKTVKDTSAAADQMASLIETVALGRPTTRQLDQVVTFLFSVAESATQHLSKKSPCKPSRTGLGSQPVMLRTIPR